MSNASFAQVRYLAESTWGTTPASAMTNLNITSESLGVSTNFVNSQYIRSDRQIADNIRTGQAAAGNIGIELQYGGYDDLFMGALMASWGSTATITATTISAAAADNSYNDSGSGFVTANFLQGQWVRVSGFATSGNNGYARLTSVAAGKLVVTGLTLTNESASPSVTIKGTQIKNGTTLKSFTLEKEFSDITEFMSYAGARVDTMQLNFAPNAVVDGSFGFKMKTGVAAGATVGTGAATAASTNQVMNSVDHVAGLRENSAAITDNITAITLNINNSLRDQPAIGTLYNTNIGVGTIKVSGTLEHYFSSRTRFQRYLDFTDTNLSWRVVDTAGNAIVFDVPTINFTSAEVVAGGIDQDVLVRFGWEASRNSTDGFTIGITRIPTP